jgi:hypothetical protein
MEDRKVELSPQAYAGIGRPLDLIVTVAASFAKFFVRGNLVVRSSSTLMECLK